jgi:plastocyanin
MAEDMTVTANVSFAGKDKKSKPDVQNVVLWLTHADGSPTPPVPPADQRPRLVQKDKSFQPHVLVVPVGTLVQFPNRDPFFHNVFSLFEGKRFDLGLYEAGSTRDVLFDKPGISYIFCNIHAEMSAVVIALATPYYGISNRKGTVTISKVPPGRYTLHTWYETAVPDMLNSMTREVTISQTSPSLGQLRLPAPIVPQGHKNMYGKDYPPPAPENPVYEHP